MIYPRCSNAVRRNAGFTLLEVLVALSILAISSMAVIRQTASVVNQQRQLEEKTLAFMIAEYHLALINSAEQWPALGRSSDNIEMANQSWRLELNVSATSDPLLRKIEISVNRDSSDRGAIASLNAYRGLH